MKVEKITHKDQERIKIDFPFNTEMAAKLRQIPDCKWSKSNAAWHIPYTKQAFEMLKTLFPNIEYTQKIMPLSAPTSKPVAASPALADPTKRATKGIHIYVLGRKIIINMPKNQADTNFMLTLRYSKWDVRNFFGLYPILPITLIV